jgi:MinD superfamily P-loop ATPase
MKIAIASGKGGTGKTLVSTNLYYSLINNGIDCTLIDCDAEEPNACSFLNSLPEDTIEVTQKVPVIDSNACIYCGACKDYCQYNAIFLLPAFKIIKVIEDLCHGCGACIVACQNNAITEKDVSLGKVNSFVMSGGNKILEACMNVGVYSPVSIIKKAIKESGDDPIVLMDSPPGTSCPFIQTVSKADYVILVTEPTPFGLSDLKQSVEILKGMSKKFGVIVNRAGIGNNDVYEYLYMERIALLAEIPFSKEIAYHYSTGELIVNKNLLSEDVFLNLFKRINQNHGDSNY